MTVKKIRRIANAYKFEAYAHFVSPLPKIDGGGFVFTIPDLPGVMADGETIEETIENGRDAFASWVSARIDEGREVPPPAFTDIHPVVDASGKFVIRMPKSVHGALSRRADVEGVSLNTLVLSFIAEGLGRRSVTPIRRAPPKTPTGKKKAA